MAAPSGTLLYQSPPHEVDIYLPDAPTTDTGGGVKHGYPASPSQSKCPCSINTQGAGTTMRQAQNVISVNNRIAFLTAALTVTLVPMTKLVAVDSGRTFIIQGLQSPNRSYGDSVQSIPAMTYVVADEIRAV